MEIKGFSPHIFWSYDRAKSIPEEVVVRQVILYGEVKDKILLSKRLGKKRILDIVEKWNEKEADEKHICFMKRVILA